MPSWFVIQGRDQGRCFELTGEAISLGRELGNSIQLHDTEVSRRHAEIRAQGGQYVLVDLQSSNGTFLNNREVKEQPLRSGDRLLVGRTLMIFTLAEEQRADDVSAVVDIVTQDDLRGSRIVKSIEHTEGGRILESSPGESPWLARARSNLEVMYATALAVSHTLDLDQPLVRILEPTFEWMEADRGCVMLLDQETEEITPKARRDRPGLPENDKLQISRTILDYVLTRREAVLTSDARDDERWDTGASIVKLGVREAICVPMQGRYGIVGLIYLDTYTPPGKQVTQRNPARFNEDHLKLMVAIAHQAALAVEDTYYYSALVQAERLAAMGHTIATISHHIKNILQGIRGGSYLIEAGLKDGDPELIAKGWSIVERRQDEISSLVMDMLSYSKQREPELVPANLNDVAADVIDLLQTRAAEAGVQLHWRPDEHMPLLVFDPEGLHRAILNVVTNAIDACEESEGIVTASTEFQADPPTARFLVEDNGGGIEPDDLRRIFTPFVSRKGARGTGLGLPVSQKILKEHGGDIAVESTPGAGSRFTLHFPAAYPATGDTGAG